MTSRIRIILEWSDLVEMVSTELDWPADSDKTQAEVQKIIDSIGENVAEDGRAWLERRLRNTIRTVHQESAFKAIPKAPQEDPEW